MSDASRHEANRASRLARAAMVRGSGGKICPAESATSLLEAIIEPGDRVTIEGDNQKQADLLASALANVDPARVHGSTICTTTTPSRITTRPSCATGPSCVRGTSISCARPTPRRAPEPQRRLGGDRRNDIRTF